MTVGGVALALAVAGCAERGTDDISLVGAPQPPTVLAFGQPADSARIAAWDIDVRPDGRGLPTGSGSVVEGAVVYQEQCASCHGVAGVGGTGRALVGAEPWEEWPASRTVGSYWPYATTLYDYIVRAMPQNAPGSLTADQTYAVIAWILHRNELIPEDGVMDAEALPAVVMPARDRFIPDDRTGGPVIR